MNWVDHCSTQRSSTLFIAPFLLSVKATDCKVLSLPIIIPLLLTSHTSLQGVLQASSSNMHWHSQWPPLLIYPIWNQRNMQWGGTPISVSSSEWPLRCQLPGCVFRPSQFSRWLSLFCLNTQSEVFHDPITYLTLAANLPGKLWVGRAAYC